MTDLRRKEIQTLRDVHAEFDTTFVELALRTSCMTALQGIAMTIAARAHSTEDPSGAMRDFKRMLTDCYTAINKDIEAGKWNPKSDI